MLIGAWNDLPIRQVLHTYNYQLLLVWSSRHVILQERGNKGHESKQQRLFGEMGVIRHKAQLGRVHLTNL